jgi:hypothetical protein
LAVLVKPAHGVEIDQSGAEYHPPVPPRALGRGHRAPVAR